MNEEFEGLKLNTPLPEYQKQDHPLIENGTPPKKVKKNSGCLFTSLILLLIFVPLCACTATTLSLFYVVANSERQITEVGQLKPPSNPEVKDYIDPEKSVEIEETLEIASDNFVFNFSREVNDTEYLYEREFILANLQAEYQKLADIFGHTPDYKISVKFTDDQDRYHQAFGREYNYELGYAAFTTYGEIFFFVNQDKVYDKQEFKRLISHELVHIYQFDSPPFVLANPPTWFYEGTAEYLSESPKYSIYFFDTAPKIRNLEQLEEAFASAESDEGLSAYLVANLFIHHLAETYGEESVIQIIENRDYLPFDELFTEVYGVSAEEAFSAWKNQ